MADNQNTIITPDFSKATSESKDLRQYSIYSEIINGDVSNIDKDVMSKLMEYIHEENKTHYGWLGKFFGTEKNASKNITFTILTFLIVLILIMLLIQEQSTNTHAFVLNLLDKLLPLFTLAFGYFFGKQ